MDINLIRLIAPNHAKNKEVLNIGDNLIEDINNLLINDDLQLVEGAKDALVDAVMVESGGSEYLFKEIVKDLKTPFILFATSLNNSLAASLEMQTYAINNNYHLIFGTGDENELASIISHASDVISSYNKIRNSKLAVIGGVSPWLIASEVDYMKVKEIFGIEMIDISYEELTTEIEKQEFVPYLPKYEEVLRKYKNKEKVNQSYYIYSALKRLVKKYNLDGLTIKCFDLIDDFKATACLALSLLNDEGITAACEGDVPALITMHIVSKTTGKPTFMANISNLSLKDQSMILAHCTVPLGMTNKYSLDTHFESGLGIAIKGHMPEEDITIVKIPPSFKQKDLLILSTKIKENLSLPNFCRTQIKVELKEEDIFYLIHKSFANHVVVAYSDIMNDLFLVLQIFFRFTEDSFE